MDQKIGNNNCQSNTSINKTKIPTKKDIEEKKKYFSKGFQFLNSKYFPQKKSDEKQYSNNKIYKMNAHRNGCMTDPRIVQVLQTKPEDKEVNGFQIDKNENQMEAEEDFNFQLLNSNSKNLLFNNKSNQKQGPKVLFNQQNFNVSQQYGTPTPTKPIFKQHFNDSSSKKLVFEQEEENKQEKDINSLFKNINNISNNNNGMNQYAKKSLFSNESNKSQNQNGQTNFMQLKDLNLFNSNNKITNKVIEKNNGNLPKKLFSNSKIQNNTSNNNNNVRNLFSDSKFEQKQSQNSGINLFSQNKSDNLPINFNFSSNNNNSTNLQSSLFGSNQNIQEQKKIDFGTFQFKNSNSNINMNNSNNSNNSFNIDNMKSNNMNNSNQQQSKKYINDIQNDSFSNIEEEDSVKSFNNISTPPKSNKKQLFQQQQQFQSPKPKQNLNNINQINFDSPPPSNNKFSKIQNMQTPQKNITATKKKNYNNDISDEDYNDDNNKNTGFSTPTKFQNQNFGTPQKMNIEYDNIQQQGVFNTPPKTQQKYDSPGLQITPQKKNSVMKCKDFLQESIQKDAKYLHKKQFGSSNETSNSSSPNDDNKSKKRRSSSKIIEEDDFLHLKQIKRQQEQNYSYDYDFEKEIGYGSFGSVWKCRNKIDHKYYAVKLSKKQIIGQGSKKEVLNEVQAMAKFASMEGSEYIVGHKNAWIEDGQLYHAMELCKGSLSKKQQEIIQFPESEIKKLLKEVCLGLRLLHKHNVGHLDIKPENLLISFNNIYKLADLGLSRVKILKRGEYFQEGDSRYLAKELLNQPKQGETFDLGKCDIFSLGVSVYELMTRKKLQGNGQEWQDIRNGILDFDNSDDQIEPEEKDFQELQEENIPSNNQIEQEVEITFEQQMLRMNQQNELIEKKFQQQKSKSTKLKLKENQTPINYSKDLKDLILSMINPDFNKRPSAEQILKSSYMQKNQKQMLKFEQKLNINLQQKWQEKKKLLKETQKIQRKNSLNF